ncbi:hypothetical protein KKA87_11805 [bacterium]|nr:hypothetical protein [bacterium]MBU1872425.1 hypothetical protein [bacterium]
MKFRILVFFSFVFFSFLLFAQHGISNVKYYNREDGSNLVDVYYDLSNKTKESVTYNIELQVSYNGKGDFVKASNCVGAVGDNIASGAKRHILWRPDSPITSETRIRIIRTEKPVDRAEKPVEMSEKDDEYPLSNVRGGYKSAKWGMSFSEVKNEINEPIISESDWCLIFDMGEDKRLMCQFYKGRFYLCDYFPTSHDDNQSAAKAILLGLENKYGKGKYLNGFVEGVLEIPILLIVWDYNDTIIKYIMHDPYFYKKYDFYVYPSSTLRIEYICKEIENEKVEAGKKEEESKKRDEIQKELNNYESDL